MLKLTQAGAILGSISPSYYSKPKSIHELEMTVIDKTLSLAGIEFNGFEWGQ